MTKPNLYHVNDFFPAMEANHKYTAHFEHSEKLEIDLKTYLFCFSYVMYYNKLDPVTAYGQAYNCENMPRKQKEIETSKLLSDQKNRAFILYLKDKLGLNELLPLNEIINKANDVLIDAMVLVDEIDRKGNLTGNKTMRDRAMAQKTLAMIGSWLNLNKMNLTLGGDFNSAAFLDIPKTMTASEATQIYTENMNNGGQK